MKFVFFVHSAVSDWNHGNAHFFRGLIRALHRKGQNEDAIRAFQGILETSGSNTVKTDVLYGLGLAQRSAGPSRFMRPRSPEPEDRRSEVRSSSCQ